MKGGDIIPKAEWNRLQRSNSNLREHSNFEASLTLSNKLTKLQNDQVVQESTHATLLDRIARENNPRSRSRRLRL